MTRGVTGGRSGSSGCAGAGRIADQTGSPLASRGISPQVAAPRFNPLDV
jgi:hypothetical protein